MASVSSLFCHLFVLGLFVVVAARYCDPDECNCIQRPTFDQKWLEDNHPDLAKEKKGYKFKHPVMTYPNCSSIVATCPTGKIAYLEFATGKLSMGTKSPLIVDKLVCHKRVWYQAGHKDDQKYEMDTFFKNGTISCACKK